MMILICGTSGSGKSKFAEDLLENFETEKKFYIATAKIFAMSDGRQDLEMLERVKRHKAMRAGKNFITIECEKNLGALNFPESSSVLIESLTTWLANEIFDSKDGGNVLERIFDDIQTLKTKCENLILVSDDIFSDGIIYDDPTEFYKKNLADLMIKIAVDADEVQEIIGGVPIKLKKLK